MTPEATILSPDCADIDYSQDPVGIFREIARGVETSRRGKSADLFWIWNHLGGQTINVWTKNRAFVVDSNTNPKEFEEFNQGFTYFVEMMTGLQDGRRILESAIREKPPLVTEYKDDWDEMSWEFPTARKLVLGITVFADDSGVFGQTWYLKRGHGYKETPIFHLVGAVRQRVSPKVPTP